MLEPAPELQAHREHRRATRRRAALIVSTIIGVLVFAAGAWAVWFYNSVQSDLTKPVLLPKLTATPTKKAAPKPAEPFTVLLLGSDIRPREKAARADTIILAKVDPQKKKVWLVSIPRDTKVRIEGHGTSKINAANVYTGPEGMITAVEDLLGVPVDYYMEVDFKGFQKAVDALGGVWIDVDVNINDWQAASYSPRHRAAKIDKGYQLLDGEHALTYVRSRAFPDADFTRMRHQQEFFRAIAKQAMEIGNVLRLPGVVRSIAKSTTTNMELSKMISVALALRGMGPKAVDGATLKGEWISPYVITDETWKTHILDVLRQGGSFDGTATAPSAGIVRPQDVTVTVRNGAGVSGVAKDAADKLLMAGYEVGEIGNAGQFAYDETLVIYKDNEGAANAVLAKLGRGRIVESRGMYAFTTDVLVVVGKDWPKTGN